MLSSKNILGLERKMVRHPTDSLMMLQRSKWPAGLFERGKHGPRHGWVLLPLCALLSLMACTLTLTVPFPRSAICTFSPFFLGGLITALLLEITHVEITCLRGRRIIKSATCMTHIKRLQSRDRRVPWNNIIDHLPSYHQAFLSFHL